MSYEIVVTENFKRQAKPLSKKYHSFKTELAELIDNLEENPTQGIFLGKDCYKIRMAIRSNGKGKSGGARVITCVKLQHETVFLLTVYDKSDKEDLEDTELDGLLDEAGLSDDEPTN